MKKTANYLALLILFGVEVLSPISYALDVDAKLEIKSETEEFVQDFIDPDTELIAPENFYDVGNETVEGQTAEGQTAEGQTAEEETVEEETIEEEPIVEEEQVVEEEPIVEEEQVVEEITSLDVDDLSSDESELIANDDSELVCDYFANEDGTLGFNPSSWDLFGNGVACSNTEIEIPEGVTKIGAWGSWMFPGITSITLSDTVEEIGNGAFNGLTSLQNITFGSGLKEIGVSAFSNTSIESINISSIRKIGMFAFTDIPNLKEVYIEGDSEGGYIELQAFRGSPSSSDGTVKFEFGENIVYIGDSALMNSKVNEIDIKGSTTDEEYSIDYCVDWNWDTDSCKTQNTYEGNGTKIGDTAFQGTTELNSTVLGEGVTKIGQSAFVGSKVVEVDIQGSEKYGTVMGDSLFNGVPLEIIHLGTGITTLGKDSFRNTKIGYIDIPGTVKSIDDAAFVGISTLTGVKFRYGVEIIGQTSFLYTALENVVIEGSDTGTVVGFEAFHGVSTLKSVEMDGVKEIGYGAFQGCDNLKNVTFGDDVKKIGDIAFFHTSVEEVNLPSVKFIGKQAFAFMTGTKTVNISGEEGGAVVAAQVFEGSPQNLVEGSKFVFGDNIIYIGSDAFQDSKVEEIIIEGNSSDEAYNCSEYNEKKSEIEIPEYRGGPIRNICEDGEQWYGTILGKVVFQGTTALKKVTLGKGVTKIGQSAFVGSKVVEVDIQGSEKYGTVMGDSLFNAVPLEIIHLGTGITTLGKDSFRGTKIGYIDIPGTVKSIDDAAFVGISTLTGVKFRYGVETIGKTSFLHTALENVVIEGSGTGTVIGYEAFHGVSTLKSVEMDGVKEVGSGAFEMCYSLQHVTYGDKIKRVGERAFFHTSVEEVNLPSVKFIGKQAFAFMTGTKTVNISGEEGGAVVAAQVFEGSPQNVVEGSKFVFGDNIIYIGSDAFQDSKVEEIIIEGNSSDDIYNCSDFIERAAEIEITEGYYSPVQRIICQPGEIWHGTIIGKLAFQGTTSLKDVILGSGVTVVGTLAFQGSSAETVIIEGSEKWGTVIKDRAFYPMNSHFLLKNLTIGEGVKYIGEFAFQNIGVSDLNLPSTIEYVGTGAFEDSYLENVEVLGSGCVLGTGAFQNNSKLKNVYLGSGVREIEKHAFANAKLLEEVKIEGSAQGTTIGYEAFQLADNLKTVELGYGVTYIGRGAFRNASSALKKIVIEGSDQGTVIGYEAFQGAHESQPKVELTLGSGITVISGAAFRELIIDDIVIPDSVVTIGEEAFILSYVKNLEVGKNLKNIGTLAFVSDISGSNLDDLVVYSLDIDVGNQAFVHDVDNYYVRLLTEEDISNVTDEKINMFYNAGLRLMQGYRVEFMDGEEIVSSKVYANGDVIQVPGDLKKEGYKFKGWRGLPKVSEDGKYYVQSEKIIAVAQREKNSGYSGGGNGGGGSSKDNQPEEKPNTSDNITDNTPDKTLDNTPDNDDKDDGIDARDSIFTPELQSAYKFAKENGITTTSSIENAKLDGKLTRIQMAKMLSQYAINVLGQVPDTTQNNKFSDVSDNLDNQYDSGVSLAYQLGIMGQNMPNNKFRPNDEVSRAEFVTAFSRLLFHTTDGEYESTKNYYTHHMTKLYNEGIVTNTNPSMKERRGYVMIMLMRSVSY